MTTTPLELDLRIIEEALEAADRYLRRLEDSPGPTNAVRARFVTFALQDSRIARDQVWNEAEWAAAAESVIAYLRAGHGDEIMNSTLFDRISLRTNGHLHID